VGRRSPSQRRWIVRIALGLIVVAAAVLTLVGTSDRVRQASLLGGLLAMLLASRYAL
jgi:uncharacterized membrane protein YkgB